MATRSAAICRVLVVEDQYLVALNLCEMIEDLGHAPVGPAATAAEALELIRTHAMDFALLDENLGDSSAVVPARALRDRGIPFVIASGYGQSQSDDPVLRAAPRLAKPTTFDMVERAIARFCLSRQVG